VFISQLRFGTFRHVRWQTIWGRHGLLTSLAQGTPGRLILSILSETNVFKTINGFGLREDFT
jgi:hypothetical protein